MNGYGKLTALFVRRVANGEKIEPRKYVDGGGLYLEVQKPGAAFWTFRYERNWKAQPTWENSGSAHCSLA